ncbi:PDZK1-interacting protein 1 [Brachyistius frenatus]|uniref:PDZK1-interacting protein 1 n=1 Tax=Brachyistius frenatus TaxID=100188 RepID=UPI0037E8AC12
MDKLSSLTSCLLLAVAMVTAQTAVSPSSERQLPQWLTGIIAVSCFLFLTFVGFLVKKGWCEESSRSSVESERKDQPDMSDTHKTHLNSFRCKDNTNVYETLVIDSTEDKTTAL